MKTKANFKFLEYDLQVAVANLLDAYALKGKLAWSHPPNEGKFKPQYLAKRKRQGVKTGEPDCVIYPRDKKTFFIELKIKGRTLSDGQKLRHAELHALGYKVYVVKEATPWEASRAVEGILRQEGITP